MYLVVKFLRSMIILGLGLVSVMYVYPRKSSDLTLLVVHLVPTWKLEPLKNSTWALRPWPSSGFYEQKCRVDRPVLWVRYGLQLLAWRFVSSVLLREWRLRQPGSWVRLAFCTGHTCWNLDSLCHTFGRWRVFRESVWAHTYRQIRWQWRSCPWRPELPFEWCPTLPSQEWQLVSLVLLREWRLQQPGSW